MSVRALCGAPPTRAPSTPISNTDPYSDPPPPFTSRPPPAKHSRPVTVHDFVIGITSLFVVALAAHSHAWLACKVTYASTDCSGAVRSDAYETG